MGIYDNFNMNPGFINNTTLNTNITGGGSKNYVTGSLGGDIGLSVFNNLSNFGMMALMAGMQAKADGAGAAGAAGAAGGAQAQGNGYATVLASVTSAKLDYASALTSYNTNAKAVTDLKTKYENVQDDASYNKEKTRLETELNELNKTNGQGGEDGTDGSSSTQMQAYNKAVQEQTDLQAAFDKAKPLQAKLDAAPLPKGESFKTLNNSTITLDPQSQNNPLPTKDQYTTYDMVDTGKKDASGNPIKEKKENTNETAFENAKQKVVAFNEKVAAHKNAEADLKSALGNHKTLGDLEKALNDKNTQVRQLGAGDADGKEGGQSCSGLKEKQEDLQKQLKQLETDHTGAADLKKKLEAKEAALETSKTTLKKKAAALSAKKADLETVRSGMLKTIGLQATADQTAGDYKDLKNLSFKKDGSLRTKDDGSAVKRGFFSKMLGTHKSKDASSMKGLMKDSRNAAKAGNETFTQQYGVAASQQGVESITKQIASIDQELAKLPPDISLEE